ncbi:hypothetical protein RRG08_015542 [Elysia crispata]|uniref:Uncharacterized protein n=1 Tax=Elysia crispata TaxID=231223 RepID=A0AAE1CZJ8_9GAST|nr:hypothetical protein RRG08_015542 [Elysia crispata]
MVEEQTEENAADLEVEKVAAAARPACMAGSTIKSWLSKLARTPAAHSSHLPGKRPGLRAPLSHRIHIQN